MLSLWEAERVEREMTRGRTHPLVVECRQIDADSSSEHVEENVVSSQGATRLFLVKPPGAELDARGMFAEIYGNLLAREFGLTTPRPVLIRISLDFVSAIQFLPATRHIALKPGTTVGCEYLAGMAPVVPDVFRNDAESVSVQTIYGLDLLLQNPDRRRNNPNCASHQGRIVAFDFELSFSFLVPLIGRQPDAWAVHEQRIHKLHIFYEELKRRRDTLDWKPFVQTLQTLHEKRLQTLFASALPEWRGYADKVTAHLHTIRSHATLFEESLIRSLL